MAEKGKVKWFSNVKGYGFLTKEGLDKDIFVHYSAIQSEGYKTLNPDEEVEFEIEEGQRGPLAKNIVRTKKPAPKPA
ncbi:MAG: cold shock domain-containing protein [Candidatus Omnitrophica bacterium]|nr:cold shock domain-containing protein [Candidatus Omnitrophota bacterium]